MCLLTRYLPRSVHSGRTGSDLHADTARVKGRAGSEESTSGDGCGEILQEGHGQPARGGSIGLHWYVIIDILLTVTSARILEQVSCYRAGNFCVFSRIQKGTPGLTRLKVRVSLNALSYVTAVLEMRQRIDIRTARNNW